MTQARLGIGLWLALLAAATGFAQDQVPAGGYIESEGVATVDAAPDEVSFWLHKAATGASVAEAVYAASQFVVVLDAALEETELPEPSSVEASDVALEDVNRAVANVSAEVTFASRAFLGAEGDVSAFGQLCQRVLDLAAKLDATVEGPVFAVHAREELVQSAVARAVEQALPAAMGAARVMRTRIDSVDTVEVREVVWNRDPESQAAQPQIRRVTCTARVKVRYLFGGGI